MVSYGDHMTLGYQHAHVSANRIGIHVASVGAGPALLLLHGWPHTWFVWHQVAPLLATRHRVIMPDLRGIGATEHPDGGYDLHTLADDAAALLTALGEPLASVVALDLGAPIAWMLAARHPQRVRKLVVMEALLCTLPGAERFLASGPPWWFGFHAIPGLAETVLAGHEAPYLDWFLRGLPREARDVFVAAYAGRLRGGFAHYRAMADNARLIAISAATARTPVPTLAIAGGVVGDALARQLAPITAELVVDQIADCGHVIPLEQPERLAQRIAAFVA